MNVARVSCTSRGRLVSSYVRNSSDQSPAWQRRFRHHSPATAALTY